ncbi:TetR/AcrR family transcriptional regulator [Pontibacter sp. 172403-2]|uniref:TetR/AcrR family transcriptional regulator n=1 Tax=Pontibacter rufus TaxID=2791028 RepID=UPI0018AF9144|nr:TetR/AcrR family transcriptional regulator [Pontibacter sp. 172403-2]MBF9251685.1 TetR/AcrR family transcriptional regulator [Pontibacter sp. 172403-2]
MNTSELTVAESKITEAAFELFCQKGIKSVSMDDIAQHLGMSKKTIYKWFENKDKVVYAACYTYLTTIEGRCENITAAADNAIEELLHLMELNKHVFTKIHPSIFHDLQKYHRTSWELWVSHKNNFILQHIRQNIARGMREGLFRSDLEIDIVARLRLSMIEMPFNPALFPPHQFDVTKVQLASLGHYMLGMATLKGHKMINAYKHITEEE